MKIGIISDTHDNVPNIKSAIRYFNSAGVEALLHCGDFIAPFALLPLRELVCKKLYLVFGNNDGEVKGIKELAAENGWQLGRPPMELELGGKKIVLLHEPDPLKGLRENGKHDLICYGHTHRPVVEKENGRLVINPGEGGGWTSGRATFAIVDLKTMKAELLVIGKSGDTVSPAG